MMAVAELYAGFNRRLKRKRMRRASARQAARFYDEINFDELNAVHLFSTSRSGSHLCGAQFHFIESCFVFRENYFSGQFGNPPLPGHPSSLSGSDFLFHSCFLDEGLQDKSGSELTHLVYMHNMPVDERATGPAYEPEGHYPVDEDFSFRKKFYIFHFRNPFQVAMSRQSYFKKNNKKDHWNITDSIFGKLLVQEHARLTNAIRLQDQYPEHVRIIFNELLCQNPEVQFRNLFSFCKIARESIDRKKDTASFFTRCFGHEESPVLDEGTGYLANPVTRKKFTGAGGHFNPAARISADRAHRNNVRSWMTEERLKIASQIFPAEAVEFWIGSDSASCEGLTSGDLLEVLKIKEHVS